MNADLNITYVELEKLVPYAQNSRTHSGQQVQQIAQSIQKFGFTNPILIDAQGQIIAGHGRVMAAKKLKLKNVPTICLEHLSDEEKRAYVIADNQLALNAGWDMDVLKSEMSALSDLGFELDLLGFEQDFVDELFAPAKNDGHADENELPEPGIGKEPVTEPGDLWVLGSHRLICGDSTDAAVVSKLLNGNRPHLMVTDPPYGVEYEPDWRNHAVKYNGDVLGCRAIGKVLNDNRADWSEAWALFPGEVAYVWHAALYASTVAESLERNGFKIRSQIVWAKSRLVISRGHYHWRHEPCWYAVKENATGHWHGDRKQTTLWEIGNAACDTGHGTQKPVECMRRPIENNSAPGQGVYEPFSGSGTTIIACEQTARICYACELSPEYVDMAIQRWQKFSGEKAILESTGVAFDVIEGSL